MVDSSDRSAAGRQVGLEVLSCDGVIEEEALWVALDSLVLRLLNKLAVSNCGFGG